MRSDFCIFILTHGRPDNVITLKTLRHSGYTGDCYLVLDDEDETYPQYCKNFGEDKIVRFSKSDYDGRFDKMDNFGKRGLVVYARNACFDIAKKLGYKYFAEYDDDYYWFEIRTMEKSYGVKHMDNILEGMLEFLETTNIKTIALSQGGDNMGGYKGKLCGRKAMNSFMCSVDRPIEFIGSINEDANTYTRDGITGDVFLTLWNVQLDQHDTQANGGGLTEAYLNYGTYVKSFYTVMCAPSCTTIRQFYTKNMRLHHRINPVAAYPKIISEKYKTESKYNKSAKLF